MKMNGLLGILTGLGLAGSPDLLAQSSALDPSFNPGTAAGDGIVETVVPQPDGKVLVCGDFTSFNGVQQGYIARLNSDGSVDTSFHAQPGYWVRHLALQQDGKIVIGGFFTNVEGVSRNRVARLNSDGTLDTTFNVGTGAETKIVEGDDKDPFVFAVAVQPDGKVLIGGNFKTYNGVQSVGLVRINPDGSQDTSFNVGAGANSWVRSLLVLPNGQIMVTGWFTTWNNQVFNRMVRLNSDGSADPTFYADFGDSTAVYTVVQQPDGKFVVGGHFFRVNSTPRTSIARLLPDGTADATFDPGTGADGFVECIRLQPDGRMLLAGYFSNVNGVVRHRVARLNPDASVDPTLSTDLDNFAWTVALDQNNKILLSGGFTTVDGNSRVGVARLLPAGNAPDETGSSGNGTGGSTNNGGSGGPASGSGGTGTVQSTPPMLLNPTLDHGEFTISVSTLSGNSYQMQYRDMNSTQWISLPPVTGNGAAQQLIDPGASTSRSRIYRVQVN
jgi:uncharacterized delta-60 repeat protein